MDKVDIMEEHIGNVSREMENLRKNQKEVLGINSQTAKTKTKKQ